MYVTSGLIESYYSWIAATLTPIESTTVCGTRNQVPIFEPRMSAIPVLGAPRMPATPPPTRRNIDIVVYHIPLKPISRRQAWSLPFFLLPAVRSSLQGDQYGGMASRGVKPLPRSKPSGLPFDARFTDVAREAGLHAPIIYGGVETKAYILETMGCGAAFLDYDNDGWLDIVQLTGRRLEATPKEAIIRLYRNNRDGTFTDVTEKSGLGRSVWACGITVGDYDNDGFDDLFITCWGQNILFHNNGDGTFTDVTAKAGLLREGVHYGTGCTWIDYDRDGRLDLFISHYLVFDLAKVPASGTNPACNWKGLPVNCGPRGLPQEGPRLYHNNGDGTFTDVTVKAGLSFETPGYGLTAVAADFDGDGWPDLYLACDSTPSLFLRNNHDGTFKEQGLERGLALNDDGQEQAGMGLGVGDFNTDGYLDILKTHFVDDTAGLYQNNDKGYFRDVTARSGLGVETRFVSWGAGIADFDNDGWPDLFLRHRYDLSGGGKQIPAVSLPDAASPIQEPGRRQIRGNAGFRGSRNRGASLQPRRCVRRFR